MKLIFVFCSLFVLAYSQNLCSKCLRSGKIFYFSENYEIYCVSRKEFSQVRLIRGVIKNLRACTSAEKLLNKKGSVSTKKLFYTEIPSSSTSIMTTTKTHPLTLSSTTATTTKTYPIILSSSSESISSNTTTLIPWTYPLNSSAKSISMTIEVSKAHPSLSSSSTTYPRPSTYPTTPSTLKTTSLTTTTTVSYPKIILSSSTLPESQISTTTTIPRRRERPLTTSARSSSPMTTTTTKYQITLPSSSSSPVTTTQISTRTSTNFVTSSTLNSTPMTTTTTTTKYPITLSSSSSSSSSVTTTQINTKAWTYPSTVSITKSSSTTTTNYPQVLLSSSSSTRKTTMHAKTFLSSSSRNSIVLASNKNNQIKHYKNKSSWRLGQANISSNYFNCPAKNLTSSQLGKWNRVVVTTYDLLCKVYLYIEIVSTRFWECEILSRFNKQNPVHGKFDQICDPTLRSRIIFPEGNKTAQKEFVKKGDKWICRLTNKCNRLARVFPCRFDSLKEFTTFSLVSQRHDLCQWLLNRTTVQPSYYDEKFTCFMY